MEATHGRRQPPPTPTPPPPLLTPLTLEGVFPIPLYFLLRNFLPWHGARDLLVRLDPPRALHGFFGSHPRSSPTPSNSNADTPTPNHTRRPHETPSFPTFDSTDTGGGYPHSPLLFPAQFSPLAWGQGPLVRPDPPRALHGSFGSHPRSSPTYSTAPAQPTTDSTTARPVTERFRNNKTEPRSYVAFSGSRQGIPPHRHSLTTPRAQPTTDSTATPSGVHFAGVDTVTDVTDATTANDRQRWFTGDTATPAFAGSPGIPPHRHTQTTPKAQPTTDSTATPSGVHFAGVDTVTDLTDATTANDRQRWFTGDTATPAFVGSPGIPPHRHTQTTPKAQPTTDATATPSGVHFAGVDTVTDVTDASTANDRQRWFTGATATPAFVGSPEIPPHRLTRRRGTPTPRLSNGNDEPLHTPTRGDRSRSPTKERNNNSHTDAANATPDDQCHGSNWFLPKGFETLSAVTWNADALIQAPATTSPYAAAKERTLHKLLDKHLIVIVQETHGNPAQWDAWKNKFRKRAAIYTTIDEENPRIGGVAIFVNVKLASLCAYPPRATTVIAARALEVELIFPNSKVTVTGIHNAKIHVHEKRRLVERCRRITATAQCDPYASDIHIVGGDFNFRKGD